VKQQDFEIMELALKDKKEYLDESWK